MAQRPRPEEDSPPSPQNAQGRLHGQLHRQMASGPGHGGRRRRLGTVKQSIAAAFSISGRQPTRWRFSTHPYEGTIWDRDGNPITFKDQYRVDFLTDRAEKFLRQKQEKPFLLMISQLEPHQQNDLRAWSAPRDRRSASSNGLTSRSSRTFRATGTSRLPDYYGACESIDASVGRVRKMLEEEGLSGEHDLRLHERSWLPLHDAQPGVQAQHAQQLVCACRCSSTGPASRAPGRFRKS